MPRRRSWLDNINPANWLKNLFPKPERRRGSRDFGGGQRRGTKPPPRRPRPEILPPERRPRAPREPRPRDLYRDTWRDEGSVGSYANARRFFDSIPVSYDNPEDKLAVWNVFVQHMVSPRPGERFNDPNNPFWSAIGIDPRDFDWSGWRAAIRPGDTP